MPKRNWDDVEESTGGMVPPGEYKAKIVEVFPEGDGNDERWGVQFKIVEGDYKGQGFFDNLFFSQKALPRVKMVCSRLGLPLSGNTALKPDMLLDLEAYVTVEHSVYEGKTKPKVPYAGYREIKDGEPAASGENVF